MFDLNIQYGTHLPALIKAINATNGPVLELGMGIFSTPYLHFACYPNRKLVSYENAQNYADWLNVFKSDNHQIHLIDDWEKADLRGDWSVALIDHEHARRRKEEIKRLANTAEYIIVHDTNPGLNPKYKFSEIFPLFKYRLDFNKEKPFTTILSNLKDPHELIAGPKRSEDANTLAHKKKPTKIVGFQSGHDVAYCILEDGVPVLVEEWERISRVKMKMGDGLKLFFDRQSDFDDINYFTFGNWGNRKPEANKLC